VALPSARARPRSPPVTFLAVVTDHDQDAFGHAGFAAARGGRSEACTVRPRGTRDGDTNIVVTSDATPRASARCETSSASPDAGGGPRGSPTAPGRDAPDQPLPAHVYVRETAPRSSPGVDAPGSRRFTNGRPASEDRAGCARPSLWRLRRPSIAGTAARADDAFSRGGRARRRRDRVTDRAGRTSRDAFHPARALAPRRPFGRPARTFHSDRGVAATPRASRRLFTAERPCGPPRPGPRARVPLPAGRASWASASLADFC